VNSRLLFSRASVLPSILAGEQRPQRGAQVAEANFERYEAEANGSDPNAK